MTYDTMMQSGNMPGQLHAIRRVAIIGAGAGGTISGATLALLCGQAGFETVLEDVMPSNLRRAADMFAADIFTNMFTDTLTGGPDPREAGFVPRYASSIEDAVRDAELVIDTVPDELESKLEILSLLDRMAPPAAIFATPTNTLSIADLASCTYRPGQCFGLRFLSLPPLQPLRVALSYAPVCEAVTIERMHAFLSRLGAKVESAADLSALP